jgi:DNA-binding Lrp family transcriptional regulator
MTSSDDVRFGNGMYKPDTLDLRITREIGTPRSTQWNVRESYASIAKRVGVDEETVRKRIKRQEKLGILQGWRAAIHPNLIGCMDAYVDLEVGNVERKDEIISQLKFLEGVVVIANFEGRGLNVLFYTEPGEALSRKIQLIRTMCGADEFIWASSLPPCDMKPSETDWRIIWSMRNDPRKNLSEIAKEARVTTRTVNRRLSFLTEHRALFLIGLPNFRQTTGITGNFLIFCPDGEKKYAVSESVISKFENTAFAAAAANYLMFNIYFHNLSEAGTAHECIKKLEGVEKVKMRIMKDLIFLRDWLDEQMKKRFMMSK